MVIEGTHDELTYLRMQCQKKGKCETCILSAWCKYMNNEDASKKAMLTMRELKSKYPHNLLTTLIIKED